MLTIGDKLNSINHQCTFRARSSVIAARAAKKAGLKDGMLQQLRRAHETCDAPVHAYSYGKSLLDCDRAASAAGFLAIAARSESPEPEWVYRHAVALERLREYEGAISELEYASNLDPARGEYHYRKGVCLASLGRHAEAFDQYEIAIELNPRDNRATDRLLKSLDQKIPL